MRKKVTDTDRSKIDSIEHYLQAQGKSLVFKENHVTQTTYFRSESKHSHPSKFEGPSSFTIVWEEPD